MRFWQFGVFDSQFADYSLRYIGSARSLYVGGSTNQESSVHANNGNNPTGYPCGWSGGGDFMDAWLCQILKGQIIAKLGQIPVILNVDWAPMAAETEVNTLRVYRMLEDGIVGIDIFDSTSRYKDASATLPWYEDTYWPYDGQDREEPPAGYAANYSNIDGARSRVSITSIVERALRDNTDIWFLWWNYGAHTTYQMDPTDREDLRPQLEFSYFFPIEFYKDDGAGNLDLTAIIGESGESIYYIGAVERSQTGSSVKEHVRNFSGAAAHIEVFDDHPEYRDPIQPVGSGTGQLDYPILLEPAVSQLYTIVFYSSTEYEVKAEAYRDNVVSLHPQIDADAAWRGTTGSTWTAPEGGFRIPAAGWQPGTLSGDEIEVAVRGNSTDETWPADANDQVEITHDSGGAPVAADWRPAPGRREHLRGSVTVDAASKFFPTRRVDPAEWPTSTPAFVQDADSIDEGTITSVQEAALGTVTFSGSGLDDLARSGNYNGNEDRTYRVRIDGTGTPDTFEWSRNGGGAWVATDVPITGALQLLEDGVYVLFTATTGHTLNDYWEWTADTFGITLGGLSVTSNGYVAGAVIGTTLPIRSVAAGIWSAVNADSGDSQPQPARIYLTSTAGFAAGQTVYIQQAGTEVSETGEIDTGGVTGTYIQLTAGLANDYTVGDFCTVVGVGNAAFWIRPVATGSTVEELKRLRLNARIL